VSASEIHSLERASQASVCGCPEKSPLVSMEAEDDGEHDGDACVVLNLAEERRFGFEKIRPKILSKFGGRHGGGWIWAMKAVLMIRDEDKGSPRMQIRLKRTSAR